jgi:hypothetical protein
LEYNLAGLIQGCCSDGMASSLKAAKRGDRH